VFFVAVGIAVLLLGGIAVQIRQAGDGSHA
jgi:hypothetical protein